MEASPEIRGKVSKSCDVFLFPDRTEHWYHIGKDGGDKERYWVVTYFHRPNPEQPEQDIMMDDIRLASKNQTTERSLSFARGNNNLAQQAEQSKKPLENC